MRQFPKKKPYQRITDYMFNHIGSDCKIHVFESNNTHHSINIKLPINILCKLIAMHDN